MIDQDTDIEDTLFTLTVPDTVIKDIHLAMNPPDKCIKETL